MKCCDEEDGDEDGDDDASSVFFDSDMIDEHLSFDFGLLILTIMK